MGARWAWSKKYLNDPKLKFPKKKVKIFDVLRWARLKNYDF